MAISKTLARRVMSKFTAGDGCWEWRASKKGSLARSCRKCCALRERERRRKRREVA